jgi:hypothetical protein
MKKLIVLSLLLFAGIVSISACDFEFTTEGNKKACKAGEEFVVNVKLKLTHRTCKVAAKDTKFKMDGVKVLGATDWKDLGPDVFSRQLKVQVLDDKSKKINISATRTCDKEGGFGVFSLPKQ